MHFYTGFLSHSANCFLVHLFQSNSTYSFHVISVYASLNIKPWNSSKLGLFYLIEYAQIFTPLRAVEEAGKLTVPDTMVSAWSRPYQ